MIAHVSRLCRLCLQTYASVDAAIMPRAWCRYILFGKSMALCIPRRRKADPWCYLCGFLLCERKTSTHLHVARATSRSGTLHSSHSERKRTDHLMFLLRTHLARSTRKHCLFFRHIKTVNDSELLKMSASNYCFTMLKFRAQDIFVFGSKS